MKIIIILSILFFLAIPSCFSQWNPTMKDTMKNNNSPVFYLSYGFAGLGSNLGSFEPTIIIKGTHFVYTYEQNSFWGERDTRIDTVCIKTFAQSSIDSVLEIIKGLKDTTIHKYNHCIMSGGINFMTVSNGIDTINFDMMNTFDPMALKIANILNQYTPADKRLWANEKMITDAEDCLARLLKDVDADEKKKKKIVKKKN